MRLYREGELRSQREEQARREDLRRAEEERGRAQGEHARRYNEGQREQGRVMQGQSTFTDPRTGQPVVLPYMGPNGYTDPATGQRYARDPQGNQFVMLPNGQWQMLYPAR